MPLVIKASKNFVKNLERKGFEQDFSADLIAILRYPLTGYALGVLLLFAFFFWFALKAGMAGIPLFAVTFSWVFKYSFACLEQTALGYRESPKLTLELINPVHQEPLKLLVLVVGLAYLVMGASDYLGFTYAMVLLFIGLLLLPASILFIAIEGSLLSAINPIALLALINRIGVLYVIACLLSTLPVFSLAFVFTSLPTIVVAMLLIYFLILTFHLLGYLTYRKREIIGMPVNISPERIGEIHKQLDDEQHDEVLDRLYILAEANNVRTAWQQLEQYLLDKNHTLKCYETVFQAMIQWPKPALAMNLGQAYITRLLKQDRIEQAYNIYMQCIKRNEAFYLETAEQALSIVKFALKNSDDKTALSIIESCKKEFSPNDVVVELQITEAQIYLDVLNDKVKAKEILESLPELKQDVLRNRVKTLITAISN